MRPRARHERALPIEQEHDRRQALDRLGRRPGFAPAPTPRASRSAASWLQRHELERRIRSDRDRRRAFAGPTSSRRGRRTGPTNNTNAAIASDRCRPPLSRSMAVGAQETSRVRDRELGCRRRRTAGSAGAIGLQPASDGSARATRCPTAASAIGYASARTALAARVRIIAPLPTKARRCAPPIDVSRRASSATPSRSSRARRRATPP